MQKSDISAADPRGRSEERPIVEAARFCLLTGIY
jgi:hypothetical protein